MSLFETNPAESAGELKSEQHRLLFELVDAAESMRGAQRAYFQTRARVALMHAKRCEQRVDLVLRDLRAVCSALKGETS